MLALLCAAAAPCGAEEILWRNPGNVARLDLAAGPGGSAFVPKPPFVFVEEDSSGSYPKLLVRDARRRTWSVKFGREVRAETFAARLAWAAGYYVEPVHFIAHGRIERVGKLHRTSESLQDDGTFENARFQLRGGPLRFSEDKNWSWTYNPFLGSHELNALKVLLILTSNWDNKDARDQDEGVNTAIFERTGRPPQYTYAFTDWGGTMGHWGNLLRRSVWNCDHFREDTERFVEIEDGKLKWGYHGRHNGDFLDDIRPADIAWLLRTVGRLQDSQLAAALKASGATRAEALCFTQELRRRITRLRAVSTYGSRPARVASR